MVGEVWWCRAVFPIEIKGRARYLINHQAESLHIVSDHRHVARHRTQPSHPAGSRVARAAQQMITRAAVVLSSSSSSPNLPLSGLWIDPSCEYLSLQPCSGRSFHPSADGHSASRAGPSPLHLPIHSTPRSPSTATRHTGRRSRAGRTSPCPSSSATNGRSVS